MNIKTRLFGNNQVEVSTAHSGSIQQWLPLQAIQNGIIITKDRRFIKVLEILPINFYLKPEEERQSIIASYAAFLKLAPNTLQIQVVTQKADMSDYVKRMEDYAQQETTPQCQSMIYDNIQEITALGQEEAITHRFFLIFQQEAHMKPKQMTISAIANRMAEEADTLKRYLDFCGLETLEPRYLDNALLELLYEKICKDTSRRVKLPPGVYDMTTTVHGVYE